MVVVEGEALPEGSFVTLLARDANEAFDISPELAAALEIALAEEERGEAMPLADALAQLRAN